MKKTLFLLLVLLTGCSLKRHALSFNSPGNLRVNESYNACSFVEKVDDIPVSKDMLQEGRIVVSERLFISCNSSFVAEKIGDHLLEYRINDSQSETFSVAVVDDIAPVISSKKDLYEVEEGNIYFDINNEVSFSDNYDEDFLHSLDHNINIDEAGEYEVKAYARDSSGNETRKTITVKVIEKEKEVETIYVNNPGSSASSSHTSTTVNQSHSNPENSSSSVQTQTSSEPAPSPSPNPAPTPEPSPAQAGISGVHNISVPVGTDFNTLYFELSNISASSSVSIDASEVNTSAPGTYTVYYSAADGSSASCSVTVY